MDLLKIFFTKTKYGQKLESTIVKKRVDQVLEETRFLREKESQLKDENHEKELLLRDQKWQEIIDNVKKDFQSILNNKEKSFSLKEYELEKEKKKCLEDQDRAKIAENNFVQYSLEMKQLEYDLKNLLKYVSDIVKMSARFDDFFDKLHSNPKQKEVDDYIAKYKNEK